jgi:hypothetical protein
LSQQAKTQSLDPWYCTNTDITERKQAQQEREQLVNNARPNKNAKKKLRSGNTISIFPCHTLSN